MPEHFNNIKNKKGALNRAPFLMIPLTGCVMIWLGSPRQYQPAQLMIAYG